MITPIVTEIPRAMSAVGRDTFIDATATVARIRPVSHPAAMRMQSGAAQQRHTDGRVAGIALAGALAAAGPPPATFAQAA